MEQMRFWSILRKTLFVLSVTTSTNITASHGNSANRNVEKMTTTVHQHGAVDRNAVTTRVEVVFSDLDGTLIHYPDCPDGLVRKEVARSIMKLPPSSTGMVGVISSQTLCLCNDIRRSGAKLVLISGMRVSTLFKRLPYLPKADAYCCEAGGRIFFPVSVQTTGSFRVAPQPYEGAQPGDLEPFSLAEDMDWRQGMDSLHAAGKDGFVGHELKDGMEARHAIPLNRRNGILWSHARALEAVGFVVDITDYSTCFRVNRKHQSEEVNFDSLVDGTIRHPTELVMSTNLGCVDFYPASSGKKNWYVCLTVTRL